MRHEHAWQAVLCFYSQPTASAQRFSVPWFDIVDTWFKHAVRSGNVNSSDMCSPDMCSSDMCSIKLCNPTCALLFYFSLIGRCRNFSRSTLLFVLTGVEDPFI